MTRQEIETALDAGKLIVLVNAKQDRWWKARRNGKTQTWVTRPDHFSIPIKAGLGVTGRIDHTWWPAAYRIEP
jgi:hypothetical protein